MPKAARCALIWSPERGRYELYERGADEPLVCAEGGGWAARLEACGAFAFQGRQGHISALSERRAGTQATYWYAYRRHGPRMVKRYLGRGAELTLVRLEQVAAALALLQPAGVPQDRPPDVPQAPAQAAPILAPKLQPPRLPAALVARGRLHALLDAGRERRLTLVAAPAGFGKTTLVASWLRAQPVAAAWVALDQADNDPIRFWRYLISACQTFEPGLGQTTLAMLAAALQPPFEPRPQEMLLTPLLNELARRGEPALLVLEDYHVISSPLVHSGLAFLLEHLPAALHLIVITRSLPPLPLARLRARGEVCELQAADLRFSAEETGSFFLQTSRLVLDPGQIAQLDALLEGWAAGLRLLALALRGGAPGPQIGQALAGFGGGQRAVREYFIAEIVQALPAHVQAFLLRTAFLERLTGPLCDAVAPEPERAPGRAAALLGELARANLFLEPLDDRGQWYRYHALFAEAMRYEARQRLGEQAVREVLLTASGWYAGQGMLAEAIEAALQAREWERAAGLIERLAEGQQPVFELQQLHERGEYVTLRRWLETLPDAVLWRHPPLCFSYALTLLLVFMSEQQPEPSVETLRDVLARAEAGFRGGGQPTQLGKTLALRSLVDRNLGLMAESGACARQALALLPAEELVWRSVGLCMIAAGELFAGRLEQARRLFLESHAVSALVQNQLFMRATLGMLSEVYVEQGLLHQALRNCRQLLAEARAQLDWDDVANALLGCAALDYRWNALEQAEQTALEAQQIGVQYREQEFVVHAALLLAQIEHARGQSGAARRRLGELIDRLQLDPSRYLRRLGRGAQALLARLLIAAGDLAGAQRWVDWLAQEPFELGALQRRREELLAARLALAQGRPDQALPALAALLSGARQDGHRLLALEALVLQALACAAARQLAEARQTIQEALALAVSEGHVRLFLDEGAPMAELLRTCLPGLREAGLRTYLRGLLKAFDAAAPGAAAPTPGGALPEPLSRQEQRVLELLAAGLSNPEIAARLVVSVNTVKAHLKSIYRKLAVRGRREASDWARQSRV